MLLFQSLHNHTTLSDGTQTHMNVLATAERNGFGVVAFTDHDIVPGSDTLAELKQYKGPVKWIVGCEMSSALPRELGGTSHSSFHILGLFVDPHNPALLAYSRTALSARVERMERLVKNLQKLGFAISAEECERQAGDGTVGRPHIVRALLAHPENAQVVEKLRLEVKMRAKGDPVLSARYEAMMRDAEKNGEFVYPFYLFLRTDSFIPDIYVEYSHSVDMDETARIIRGAGGVAILAHWWTVKDKITPDMLRTILADKRLDGVEISSHHGDPKGGGDAELLRNIARETECMVTIGVDAHKAEDFETFAKNPLVKETPGIVESIINRVHPSLEWTNL